MKTISKLLILVFAVISVGCENEEVEIVEVNEEELIQVNSSLYDDMERMVEDELVCLDFIYNFSLRIYNEDLVNVETELVNNDSEFLNILNGLPQGYSISFSFPVQGTNANGEVFIIDNKEDLEFNIESCLQDEFLEYCNEILVKEKCVWRILDDNSEDTDFTNSFFEIDESGIANLVHEGEEHTGTWILFYIEDELHLNIFIEEESEVSESWNFDWLVNLEQDDHMILTNDNITFELLEKCNSDTECNHISFESCRTEDDVAIFELDDYEECIFSYLDYSESEVDLSQITFYESQEDAENNSNPISSPFLTAEEVSFIVARLDNIENENTEFLYVKLKTLDCP